MSTNEENLSEVLTDSYVRNQRASAIITLGGRTHLSIGKLAKLLEHPDHGPVIATITLDDLLKVSSKSSEDEDEDEVEVSAPKAKKTAKVAPPKVTPKAAAPKTAPKTAKAAPKAAKAAAPTQGGKRERLDRDTGFREITAALTAHKEPMANGDLVKATGYTAMHIRTFLNEMIEAGTVTYEGKGRGTKYLLVA